MFPRYVFSLITIIIIIINYYNLLRAHSELGTVVDARSIACLNLTMTQRSQFTGEDQ